MRKFPDNEMLFFQTYKSRFSTGTNNSISDRYKQKQNLLANNLHTTIEKKKKKKEKKISYIHILKNAGATLLRIFFGTYAEKNQHASRDVSASKIIQRTSVHEEVREERRFCSREASFLNIEMYSREWGMRDFLLLRGRPTPPPPRGTSWHVTRFKY